MILPAAPKMKTNNVYEVCARKESTAQKKIDNAIATFIMAINPCSSRKSQGEIAQTFV